MAKTMIRFSRETGVAPRRWSPVPTCQKRFRLVATSCLPCGPSLIPLATIFSNQYTVCLFKFMIYLFPKSLKALSEIQIWKRGNSGSGPRNNSGPRVRVVNGGA